MSSPDSARISSKVGKSFAQVPARELTSSVQGIGQPSDRPYHPTSDRADVMLSAAILPVFHRQERRVAIPAIGHCSAIP